MYFIPGILVSYREKIILSTQTCEKTKKLLEVESQELDCLDAV